MAGTSPNTLMLVTLMDTQGRACLHTSCNQGVCVRCLREMGKSFLQEKAGTLAANVNWKSNLVYFSSDVTPVSTKESPGYQLRLCGHKAKEGHFGV